MGIVIFNGISTQDYAIQVEHPPEYRIPERDYEIIHIPGRNGDFVIDNGSWKNVSREYEIAIGDLEKNFTDMAGMISLWLNSASGYARLEDSYEPEYYRMAMFHDEVSIENIMQHAGRVTVEFDCKPQRFLKSGEEKIVIKRGESIGDPPLPTTFALNPDGPVSPSTYIKNPTMFNALPKITVYGSGNCTLYVGQSNVELSNIEDFVTVDSEIQDVFKGTINKNMTAVINGGFPKLGYPETFISWIGGSIDRVEVTPRWWIL